MSKDPAFLFYSSDFITGVSDLTMEERGQYITLLCLHHQKGRLTKKAVALAVGNVSADVIKKFKIDENDFYYNERLEFEAKKRADHSEKQRQRALSGWEKRKEKQPKKSKATADATALPLEDENEIENIDINAYEYLIKNEKEKIDIFEIQNKKSFTDYQKFVDNFNFKVEKEELEFKPKVLLARLQLLNINWDKTPKKQETTFQSNRE